MTKISNCPLKDVLCLISLTTDIRLKMIENGYNPDDAIKKLKGIGVDVCDLTIQNLSKINQYRLVIIICHHIQSQDIDALVLSDNTLLPVDVFVNAISKEFTGLLDLAICQSKEMAYAIKALSKFSDSIRIQYAEDETDVEFRLCYIYPDLLKIFSFDPIDDYKERYIEAYRKAVQYAIRRQNEGVKDPNSLPEGTKLGGGESSGDVKTTIYSPLRVVRGECFSILVAMHFDADNGTLFIDRRRNDPSLKGEEPREHNVVLNNVHYGDELSIKMSFEDATKYLTDHIWVNNDNPKHITISDKLELEFEVFVDAEYPYSYFKAILEYIKDGHCLKKFDYHKYEFKSAYLHYSKLERSQINLNGTQSYKGKQPKLSSFLNMQKEDETNKDEKDVIPYKVGKCFNLPTNVKFRKDKYEKLVKRFYNNISANLALIEIVLYCHGQLKQQNSHKLFLEALVDWEILKVNDEKALKQIYNALADKFKRLVNDKRKIWYKEWESDVERDKTTCQIMGNFLGDDMPYSDIK